MTTIYEQEINDNKKTQGFKVYSRYFKFTITNPGSGSGNKAGFIDPMKAQDYVDFDEEAGTLEKYEDKARGYIRWFNMCLSLSKFGVFYQQVKKINGATSLDTPSSVIFVMGYEQADEPALYIKDGDKEYKGAEQVFKYLAGYALCHSYKSFANVWNPTVDDIGRNPSGAPLGLREEFLTAEKIVDDIDTAMGSVEVEEIDNPLNVEE